MILLTATSTLRVYLGASATTNQLPIVATYVDSNASTFDPQAAETQTNDTTPVTVIGSPAAGLTRQVKYLSILNTDSVTNDVYIEYHTTSTDRLLFSQSLTPNQKIEFLDTEGFEVLPAAFINVTGDAVSGLPFIMHGSAPYLSNYRILNGENGIVINDSAVNEGDISIALSGNLYTGLTGHLIDEVRHIFHREVAPSAGEYLMYGTGEWVNSPLTLGTQSVAGIVEFADGSETADATVGDRALSPASIANIKTADLNNDAGFISDITAGVLADLSDVSEILPSNKQYLMYGTGGWVNSPLTTATDTVPGIIEIASNPEASAGSVSDRAIVPSNLSSIDLGTFGNAAGYLLNINNENLADLLDVVESSPQVGQFLFRGTGQWVNSFVPTGSVSNLRLAVKNEIGVSGEFFKYRGGLTGYWDEAENKLTLDIFSGLSAGGASYLDDLLDVNAPSPNDGEVLTFNTLLGDWVAASVPSASAASETVAGIIEIATDVEAAAASATDRALVPNNLGSIDLDVFSNVTAGYIKDITTSNLAELNDVSEVSIQNFQYLMYASGNWINSFLTQASLSNAGIVEFADNTEAAAASVLDRALTPSNIGSINTADLNNDAGFISDITAENLDDLANVIQGGSILSGHALVYDGINWRSSGLTTGNIEGFRQAVLDNISVTTASETQAGIIEIATNGEAEAGAATDKALVPSNLGSIPVSALNNDLGFISNINAENLDDLSDVDVPTPTSGNYLHWNGSTWIAEKLRIDAATETTAGIIEIATNAEAGAASATDKALVPNNLPSIDLNVFDNTIAQYLQDITAENIGDLADVTESSPANTHYLMYGTGGWTNSPLTKATDTVAGIIEIATNGEATAAAETDKALVPSNLGSIDLGTFTNTAGYLTDITNENLGDLVDVTIAGATQNQVLAYDGASWINSGLLPANIAGLSGYISGASLTSLTGEIGLSQLSGVSSDIDVSGYYLFYNGTGWTGNPLPTQIVSATKEPIGFENKADSTISFNTSTREFSIGPAVSEFVVWCNGNRFVKAGTETVTITNTDGLYYIYYNHTAQLKVKTTYFDFENEAPVAYIYWNSSASVATFFADERHGVTLDWQTHEYLHRTRGAAYANGFGASNYYFNGDGTLDADAQLYIANGTFFDEDIQIDITHAATPTADTWEQFLQGPAEIPVFYINTNTWVKDTATTIPIKAGVATARYNRNLTGSWDVADIQNNKLGISWILATNNLNEPIISLLGQSEYGNLGEAEEVDWSTVDVTALPIFELRPLYKIIFETKSSYTNSVNSKFVSIQDLRLSQARAGTGPAFPVSDHGTMVGLADDDHPHYMLNDGTRAFSSQVGGVDPTGAQDLATKNYVDGKVPAASETVAGIIEIADVAEAAAGSATNKALVPSNLSSIDLNIFSNTTAGYIKNINAESITDLSDVVAAQSTASGMYLHWNGTSWFAEYLREASITGLTPTIQRVAGAMVQGQGNIAVTFAPGDTNIILSGVGASTSASGVVSIATNDEAANSAVTDKVIVPSNLASISLDAFDNTTSAFLKNINGESLNDLSDVTTPTPTNGDLLYYNGGWINSPLTTLVPNASTTVIGIVELADNTEAGVASATDKALTPGNIGSIKTTNLNNDAGFISDITAESLGDLSNVDLSVATSGHYLHWNGTNWVPENLRESSITGLRAAIGSTGNNGPGTSPGFFEYRGGLTGYWDGATQRLTLNLFSGAGAGGGGSSTLAGLSDVSLSSPAAGQFLGYDGASWINSEIQSGHARWAASGLEEFALRLEDGGIFQTFGLGPAIGSRQLLMYVDSSDSAPADGFYNISLGLFKYFCDQGAIQFSADKLQAQTISSTAPISGQVLYHNGTQWMPSGIIGHGTEAPVAQSTGEYYIQYYENGYLPAEIGIACSDETSDLTVGTAKATFRMPYRMSLTGVRANVNTAPVGSTITVDVNKNGSTIFSTILSIDASEKTSVTAATPFALSTNPTTLADDDEIIIDIDQIGSSTAGKGLKIWLLGTRL